MLAFPCFSLKCSTLIITHPVLTFIFSSEEQSRLAARKYARVVQKLGFPAKFLDFKIQNMVGSCDVKFPIRLEGLVLTHQQFSRWFLMVSYICAAKSQGPTCWHSCRAPAYDGCVVRFQSGKWLKASDWSVSATNRSCFQDWFTEWSNPESSCSSLFLGKLYSQVRLC